MDGNEAVLIDGEQNFVADITDRSMRDRLIRNHWGCVECDEDAAYWIRYPVERRVSVGGQTSSVQENRASPAYCEEHLPSELRRETARS